MVEKKWIGGLQTGLGLLTLATVLLVVLIEGGNLPIAWSLLAIMMLPFVACQLIVGFVAVVPVSVQKLVGPALLFFGALGWAWVQTLTLVEPPRAHPFWTFVPDTSGYISADPNQGRHAVMRHLSYASVLLVMVWTCAEPKRAALVLKVIAIFSALCAAYGLVAFSTGNNFFLGENAVSVVVQSTFTNRNSFATYAVFGALANIAAFLHVSERQGRTLEARIEGFFAGAWIYVFGALLCVGALTLTQSRAGGISGMLGLLAFVSAWPRGHAQVWDKVMLGVLALMLLFFGFTSATGMTERLLATTGEEGRFVIYPLVVEAILDRPVLGHGLGAFHDAFRPYNPAALSNVEWARAHNTYLELAFGLGLPATCAFFAAVGLIAWRIYRGTRIRRKDRAYSCFAFGCLVTAAFHSAFDFSLQIPAVAALFACILGLGYAQSFTFAERKGLKSNKNRPAVPTKTAPDVSTASESGS